MQVKFANHVVSGLEIDGENIIAPWSIECGDTASFFSLENGGWRTDVKWLESHSDDVSNVGEMQVRMTDGMFNLHFADKVTKQQKNSCEIGRSATLTALEPTLLMDFVIQYRFRKEHFHTAKISGQEIKHTNSNTYYQFPVQEVELKGQKYTVKVQTKNSSTAGKFHQEMYVRDYKDLWIVHARLMPAEVHQEMIKLNVKWFNKALPEGVSKQLLKIRPLRNFIWYRSEKSPYPKWQVPFKLLRPTGYSLSRLDPSEALAIDTQLQLRQN